MQKQKKALLMFSDKSGSEETAQRLIHLGFKLYGSQGTTKYLNEHGLSCIDIAMMVGDPILNHKVVSLSREIHAGLLAETVEELNELENLGIMKFDVVLIDLYPLENAILKTDATFESVRAQTDIGGPTAASSAVKGRRVVGIEIWQREQIVSWLEEGKPSEDLFLLSLETHVNFVVSRYRGLSVKYLDQHNNYFVAHGTFARKLKYGENPHQKFAALYAMDDNDLLALHKFEIVYSGPDSYVTATDIDRGVETITRICAGFHANTFVPHKVMVALKHGNPCGASYGTYEQDIIRATISGDCEAVMGAVVVCNFRINKEFLELMFRANDPEEKKWGMIAGIVCKEITPAALVLLEERKSNCIVYVNDKFDYMEMGMEQMRNGKIFRAVRGGVLVQDAPVFIPRFRKDETYMYHCGDFSRFQTTDLIFAWGINSTSNSNTITIVRERKLLGDAVGQQKRVASSVLAVEKAQFALSFGNQDALNKGSQNAIAWGDSFFPYPDGIEVLQKAGVMCVIATHGSKRDQSVIDFCKENDMAFATYPNPVARGFFGH